MIQVFYKDRGASGPSTIFCLTAEEEREEEAEAEEEADWETLMSTQIVSNRFRTSTCNETGNCTFPKT